MGIVGSEFTLSTAVWPHTAAMATPACLAGGEVIFPWAEAAAAKKETIEIEVLILKAFASRVNTLVNERR